MTVSELDGDEDVTAIDWEARWKAVRGEEDKLRRAIEAARELRDTLRRLDFALEGMFKDAVIDGPRLHGMIREGLKTKIPE